MNIEKTESITLQSVPYQEKKRILSLLTKNGIISILVKNLSQKNTKLLSFTNPFCLAEITYIKKKSDIHLLEDVNILDQHYFLRENLDFINTAFFLKKTLLEIQQFFKKYSLLYLFFKKYIKKIPIIDKNTLISSFLLKILYYEKLLDLKKNCNKCNEKASFIYMGESLCKNHKEPFSHIFSISEFEKMEKLIKTIKFSEMKKIKLDTFFKEKIEQLFKDLI
ncbi:MAG: hypothetical protein AMS24_04195 [Chlamydiae bacterium SM23_39]|nr:MAG: hypothetical protein AMS24_04195 [Chlamydiae bacterium SM23_39]